MPTYEYLCGKCNHEFEREQRITEDPIKTCPKCRARKVQRLISRTGFVLKGSGWYSDLYSSSKPASEKDAAASDAKADTKADAKSDGKAESKPEAKPKTESKSSDTKSSPGKKPSGKSTNAA
jgi:putative FmdB family regulatory protein